MDRFIGYKLYYPCVLSDASYYSGLAVREVLQRESHATGLYYKNK